VAVRLGVGVSDEAGAGVKASAGGDDGAVGLAASSVTRGAAVGGVSTGEQPVKRRIARKRAVQIWLMKNEEFFIFHF